MGQWLNRCLFILFLSSLLFQTAVAQQEEDFKYKDYKDKDQFQKFFKRRRLISAWQINQLKTGALIVRLKTNKKLIDALIAKGNPELANQKEIETFVMNKNIMMAYLKSYNFSKIYFINSQFSDSLLRGTRAGIFLDTNMQIDPNINMSESFYLLAERDFAYNSSIGFVPLDSAEKVVECGNPGAEMSVVIKNKFGHQLKNPFPYAEGDYTLSGIKYEFIGARDNKLGFVWFLVESSKQEMEIKKLNPQYNDWIKFEIKKQFEISKLLLPIQQLNQNLKAYYQATPPPDLSRVDPEIKKFLY